MEPAITIVKYLWDARNGWLKHDEDCECPPEHLIKSFLTDVVSIGTWSEVVIVDGFPELRLFQMTPREWSEVCGPRAQRVALQSLVEQHLSEVANLMSIQATWDRLAPNDE